jgi:hypothetical protein
MNENNFQKQYSASPQKIKDFLISDELTEITKNIVILTKLNIEQTTQLTEIVSNVLIGKISQEDFSKEIEFDLKISASQIRIIVELVNKKIFEQFSMELEQYKLRPSIPEKQESPESQEPQKITTFSQEPHKKTPIKKTRPKQILSESEQIIPEYSFPEPSEVKIEKPVSKIEELKKVVTPTIPSEQQEKIRENLLAAMQKKEAQPKILEQMKKVLLKPLKKEEEKELPEKKKTEELTSSKILSGEGKKFEDEEVFVKTKEEKPYILDVKLKEENVEEKETPTIKEPIPYRKYQKKNPFGKA